MHRWDAEVGAGLAPRPFDVAVATEGVEEYVTLVMPLLRSLRRAPEGPSVQIACTDGDKSWYVRFAGDGGCTVSATPVPVAASLRGPQRHPPRADGAPVTRRGRRLARNGDPSILERHDGLLPVLRGRGTTTSLPQAGRGDDRRAPRGSGGGHRRTRKSLLISVRRQQSNGDWGGRPPSGPHPGSGGGTAPRSTTPSCAPWRCTPTDRRRTAGTTRWGGLRPSRRWPGRTRIRPARPPRGCFVVAAGSSGTRTTRRSGRPNDPSATSAATPGPRPRPRPVASRPRDSRSHDLGIRRASANGPM